MRVSTKRGIALFLGTTLLYGGCIGGNSLLDSEDHTEKQVESRNVETDFNCLGDFLNNEAVIEAARIAEAQGIKIDFQTGESPPHIEGPYTLNWQRNPQGSGQDRAGFHWFNQTGNLISCSSYDENALPIRTFIGGEGDRFTTYSVWQTTITFEGTECQADHVIIFDGERKENGDLDTSYIVVPAYNHTPDDCQGFKASSGRALFERS